MSVYSIINLFLTVKEHAAKNPFGFTFNVALNHLVTSGYICAYKDTQNSVGDLGLARALQHAKGDGGSNYVGGWFKKATGDYLYDSCMVLDSLDLAISSMVTEDQDAIYCASEGVEVFASQVAEIMAKVGIRGFNSFTWSIGANKELICTDVDGEVFNAQQPAI